MSTSETVIRVENLGKRYRIGTNQPPAKTLGGKLKNTLTSPFEWLEKQMRPPTEEETLWALNDVSFEVNRGEVVGVIGRNGAGKSTLLKILSRITEPSIGFAEIRGRVGALLEVGTGMHPELTGRENIYQNGCILGMRKWEIDKKFDEIVDFSGIKKFIDTPVKRYSSGQRVRLGFAIAAHLEPEILVVDEVLAVGDIEFQNKCLGKMQDIADRGRTVLFVSHNMGAVENLCSRAILLNNGTIFENGPVNDILKKYTGFINNKQILNALSTNKDRSGNGMLRIRNVKILSNQSLRTNCSFTLSISVENCSKKPISKISLGYSISTSTGTILFISYSDYSDIYFSCQRENIEFHIEVRKLPLTPGHYEISARLLGENIELDWPRYPVLKFEILNSGIHDEYKNPHSGKGPISLSSHWKIISN